ncbi:MAG: glycosyltransferase family 2 protein [Planctomycetaceae bacterium]
MVARPKITICIPHWQVGRYMTLCLRSIRKHSLKYNLDVLVVDNGSKDDSLAYLRSLGWIRLVERPEEVHTNWPRNVFTAWDYAVRHSDAPYFVSMHSDVFIKSDHWLDPLLREIERSPSVAASGAWKLELEHPLYRWQKHVLGYTTAQLKTLFGRRRAIYWQQGHYPRDYCAMYRREIIARHDLTFLGVNGYSGGSHSIAQQLIDAGYQMGMVDVREMSQHLVHVAHGTAAIVPEKPLNHRRAQKKVERKVARLLSERWIKSLEADAALDGLRFAA